MTFVQGPGSRLFQPMFNGQPISVLFLVENSSEMKHIWSSVFERSLKPIAQYFQLAAANASAPLSVVVLESFPTENGASGLAPRQYSDCQTAFSNMRFNPHPENRISIGRITQGIELLENVKSVGQPPSLHFVVVAAKPPADDEAGVPLPSDYSPWRFVSQRLVASRIQCHLVVTQEVSVTSLAKFYEETLRLTPNLVEEAYCDSQNRSGIIVRLSTRRLDEVYLDQATTTSQYAQPQAVASRRNSYPASDSMHAEQMNTGATPFSTDPDVSPRLVSQLQSVHGLTKKKVYGTKPAREPFLGGEVREKFAPPPLTTTMGDISSGGGRVLTHSKIDRIGRLGQASPTDLHARRHLWGRRDSRLSTPEADSLAWGNAQAGYQQNSSATPNTGGVHMAVDASASMAGVGGHFAMDPAPTHMSDTQAAMAQYAAGGMADPQWLSQSQQQPMQPQAHHQAFPQQQQYSATYTQPTYYNQAPVQSSPTGNYLHNNAGTTMSDMHPQRPFATTYNSYPPFPASSNSQLALPTPTVPSNAGPLAPPTPGSGVPELTFEELASVRPPKRTVVSTPADNETFDFSASFVAASRVMFEEEVVPSFPDIPTIGSDVPTQKLEADLAKLDSPAEAGELFATRMSKQQAPSPQEPAPASASASSSSSSSSRGSKVKVPQTSAPHHHSHLAQGSAMQRPMAQMVPPPPQQQQQSQLPGSMSSMAYGGGYHDATGPSNIGHATFSPTYYPATSSLTGWG